VPLSRLVVGGAGGCVAGSGAGGGQGPQGYAGQRTRPLTFRLAGVARHEPTESISEVSDVLTGVDPNRTPLLTIVIPTRNYASYVGQAIKSALAQGYRPTEVIVVDDGSTDETPRVLQAFESAIRVLRLDGRGVSAARNAGLAEARGEYVLFLD